MGQLPEGVVTLVETPEDVEKLNLIEGEALGYVTQTTLSVDDTQDVIVALEKRFPHIHAPSSESICYATTNRQEAVKAAAPDTDMFLVVGAPNSSNSKRLVEVAKRAGAKDAKLVQRATEINWADFENAQMIAISAGASAPEVVVNEILDAFAERFNVDVEPAITVTEDELFPVVKALRDIELTQADMAFVNG